MRRAIEGLLICLALASQASAQGVTAAAVRGHVRIEGAGQVTGVQVRVTHMPSGTWVEATTRNGFFLVQGLQPGGPYHVTVRRPGFLAQNREIHLRLGQMLEVDLLLRPAVTQLDSVRVSALGPARDVHNASGGTTTTIDRRTLGTLPSLNRDFYDFVRLVPQVSTKLSLSNAGFSGGGAGFRFNNFLINGVSERSLGGNVSAAFSGARSMSLEAVQEYQVLLAPYDVRFGDFAGGLVNTVTRSGGNDFSGSIFIFARNDAIARRSPSQGSYDRLQYGGSLGGPLIRNRVHFFVAPELQLLVSPAPGPYLGQPAGKIPSVPVSEGDIERMMGILQSYGLEPGSAEAVTNRSPLRNLFAKLDFSFPEANTRAAVWQNRVSGSDGLFTRTSRDTFALSSARTSRNSASTQTAIQVHTSLRRAGGGHNELLLSRFMPSLQSVSPVAQPIIRVSVPSVSGGRITLNSGTHETAQGSPIRSRTFSVKDNLTLPLGGTHIVTLGAEAERFYLERGSLQNSFGTWSFDGLEALEQGVADRYEIARDLGAPNVPIEGWQHAMYATDSWSFTPRLAITGGVRADLLSIDENAPYHSGVDSIFGRRTDAPLSRKVEISPRIGFVWKSGEDPRHTVRGGAGLFTSRFPLAWAHSAVTSYGAGTGILRCGRSVADLGLAPRFNPDHLSAPAACANGEEIAGSRRGDVNLLADDLRLMRVLRGSLAYERLLSQGLKLTGEVMGTRGLSEFKFVNLNLSGPVGTDRNDRVMYGTLSPGGAALPSLQSTFSEVIDLVNISGSRSYQLSGRLEKSEGRFTGAAAYTFSRVRDAVTPVRVNTRGTVAWGSSRVLSGRHDDRRTGISSNDLPHRVSVAGTYALPYRWRTIVSFYYLGESGRPFTYLYYGTLRRGDLNADGTNTNDPAYIPKDAHDLNEIQFGGDAAAVARQQSAFESLIESTGCLRKQRGRILERNSCREPWSNITAFSLRQTLPIARRDVELQADLYNALNLVSGDWGIRKEAAPALLEHLGQANAGTAQAQPIVFFDADAPRWTTLDAESAFQFQLALRYRF